MKIFWKGSIIDASRARVHVSEIRYFQGSALVETLQIKDGRLQNLELHLARLRNGASLLILPEPPLNLFRSKAAELIRINRLKQGVLRCRYFSTGELLMHPMKLQDAPLKGIRLLSTPVRHYGPESLQGRVKANSMLNNLLARWESQALAEDGLRLTAQGYVAEGVWTNILIEKNGVLITPPLSEGILNGCARERALESRRKRRRPVLERPLTRYDLYTADKVWVSSSLRGLLKVIEVDGRPVGKAGSRA